MRPSQPHHMGGGAAGGGSYTGGAPQYSAAGGYPAPHTPQYAGSATPSIQQYMGARIPGYSLQQRLGQHIKYYPSLSGSETDVSTSTENLTQEERYVLRNMERQEPQGEEQHHPVSHQQALAHLSAVQHSVLSNHLLQSPHQTQPGSPYYPSPSQQGQSYHPSPSQQGPSYHPPPPYSDRLIAQQIASNNAKREAMRLDAMIAASRQGTPVGTPTHHPAGSRVEEGYKMSAGSRFPPSSHYQTINSMAPNHQQDSNLSRLAPSVYSHPTVTDPLLKAPKSFYQDPSVLMPKKGFNISSSGAYFDTSAVSKENELQAQNDIIAQLTREMRLNNNGHLSGGSDVESSGSTSTLNNPAATAERIAALALQAKHNTSNIPVPVSKSSKVNESPSKVGRNPPAYTSPAKGTFDLNVSRESQNKLKQQQEIRKMSLPVTEPGGGSAKPDNLPFSSYSQPDLATSEASRTVSSAAPVLSSPDAPQYTQEMVDIIINENRELKSEVEMTRRKISKLDNLDKEMMKIHEAYQALREHSEKREMLEKSARTKLQAEILNQQEINKEIRERHDAVMAQIMSGDTSNIPGLDSILRGEILRKDALITQLANQNKELLSAKERQEIECSEQRETLQEQRTHIDVLDSALSSAQNNVLRLEEELRQKDAYADRVKQMTKSLEQLQAASEKREAMEKKLRAKLEDELKDLRAQQEKDGVEVETDQDVQDFQVIARKLSESEEKIMRLESERTQWEQRYLEESAMRQVAIDAASIPKDAKISALEKNSAESEKKIAEARSEKMKQMGEMQQAQRRIVDMDLKLKSLETSLAERNAMVKVLQKRAFDKPGDPENVLNIPIHDTPPSSIIHSKQLSTSHLGSPLSQYAGNHASQHSTPVPFSMGHSASPLPFSVSHASQHSTPVPFSMGHTTSPLPFSLNHSSKTSSPVPFGSIHPHPGSPHAHQLSMGHLSHASLPMQGSHTSQLSTPLPLSSPRHAVSDFYEGISSAMSSTARGPLGKLGMGARVRSGSPAHIQRSATPSDLLRSNTPTRDSLIRSNRRDSAPADVFSACPESPGKTLISTSELYSTGATVSSGGTLPKMSFAMMKEENSRTLPTKGGFSTLAESLREHNPESSHFQDKHEVIHATSIKDREDSHSSPSRNMDSLHSSPTRNIENVLATPTRHMDNFHVSPTRLMDNIHASPTRNTDNIQANPSRHTDNIHANPSRHTDNIHANPTRHSDNIQANPSRHTDNIHANPSRHTDNIHANPTRHSDNIQANPSRLSDNIHANPSRHMDNIHASPTRNLDNFRATSTKTTDGGGRSPERNPNAASMRHDMSRDSSRAGSVGLDSSANSSLLNKDSLLLALQQEKEKRPENFWRV